jgi:hypothetical protein
MVYVHNFKHPDTPRSDSPLEGGKGTKFRKSLGKIISMMKEEIKKALKSQNYVLLRDKMVHEVDKKENHLLSDLEIELQSESFKIVQLEESGENLDIWPVLEEEPVPFRRPAEPYRRRQVHRGGMGKPPRALLLFCGKTQRHH